MIEYMESGALLLALLNPFLLIVYLAHPLKNLNKQEFRSVILRAGIIAALAFCCFAVLGDALFSTVFRAEFASFQIFGGLVFVLIGIQFLLKGPTTIELLQGKPAHLSGAIAMPILIGPGTISASVVIGKHHDAIEASLIVIGATLVSLVIVLLLKELHDYVHPRREALVDRYIDITGRITGLYVGTVAVEMIMQGLYTWIQKLG